VRVIAVDRPGYGDSDFEIDRTYLGWARDMDDFTTKLGIDRFVVAGYSSGGPHALACGSDEDAVGPYVVFMPLGRAVVASLDMADLSPFCQISSSH